MFRESFLVLCSVHFIWCELTRNDINISSPPLAGGIIPSNSISLNTATATKYLPTGELKTQNVTLNTPLVNVSVKNKTVLSAEDVSGKVANTLTNLDEKFNQDLLLGPEQMINPQDIMLDLNIPVRITELEDLTKVSSIEQFKQKMLRSPLMEKLFSNIESKAKYYSVLENVASGFRSKRRKRDIQFDDTNNIEKSSKTTNKSIDVPQSRSRSNFEHRIFHHPPKNSNSEIVYHPDPNALKSRTSARQVNPSSRSEIVGAIHPIHHVLPLPHPIRAPIIPHHPIHHVPHLIPPPPPHLPVIPPAVLAQILRARARHPLPPLLPALLPLARNIGLLPLHNLFSPFSSYSEEVPDIIITRPNPALRPIPPPLVSRYPLLQQTLSRTPIRLGLPELQQNVPHSIYFGQSPVPFYNGLPQPMTLPDREQFQYVSHIGRSIFDHLPPFKPNDHQRSNILIDSWPNPQKLVYPQSPTVHLPSQPHQQPIYDLVAHQSHIHDAPIVHLPLGSHQQQTSIVGRYSNGPYMPLVHLPGESRQPMYNLIHHQAHLPYSTGAPVGSYQQSSYGLNMIGRMPPYMSGTQFPLGSHPQPHDQIYDLIRHQTQPHMPISHLPMDYHQSPIYNMIHQQPRLPVRFPRPPRALQNSAINTPDLFSSMENTKQFLSTALFTLMGNIPTITR